MSHRQSVGGGPIHAVEEDEARRGSVAGGWVGVKGRKSGPGCLT